LLIEAHVCNAIGTIVSIGVSGIIDELIAFLFLFCFFVCRLWWSVELSGQNESATAAAESDVVDAANNIKGYGAVHE